MSSSGRIWAAAVVILLTACGGSRPAPSTAGLTADERAGLLAAQQAGCSSCHGSTFDGGVGPSWVGLAGSTVLLVDGSTVTADDAYLTRSIEQPSAQLVQSYTISMPTNALPAATVAKIVAYIESLGS